jgi:hypothetical protein
VPRQRQPTLIHQERFKSRLRHPIDGELMEALVDHLDAILRIEQGAKPRRDQA